MANSTPILPGFVHRDVPLSPQEALSRQSFSAATEVTKNALSRFLLDHFEGVYKPFFRAAVSSSSQFILDVNSSERMSVPVQLARRYPDLMSRLPCILINCKRAKPMATSIAGGLEGSFWSKARQEQIMLLTARWKLGIEIYTAALDPQQADRLMESVSLIFTTLRTVTASSLIDPTSTAVVGLPNANSEVRGDHWVVTLPPVAQIDIEGPTPTRIDESKKDDFYSYAIDLPCDFESNLHVSFAQRTTGTARLSNLEISSGLPDRMPLGATVLARVVNRPHDTLIQSSDTTVATVDSFGNIRPKRLGTFQFQVLRVGVNNEPDVLYSKEIQVVP